MNATTIQTRILKRLLLELMVIKQSITYSEYRKTAKVYLLYSQNTEDDSLLEEDLSRLLSVISPTKLKSVYGLEKYKRIDYKINIDNGSSAIKKMVLYFTSELTELNLADCIVYAGPYVTLDISDLNTEAVRAAFWRMFVDSNLFFYNIKDTDSRKAMLMSEYANVVGKTINKKSTDYIQTIMVDGSIIALYSICSNDTLKQDVKSIRSQLKKIQ